MIRILRLARPTALLTAASFETLFARHVGSAFAVAPVPTATWCADVLGPAESPWPFDTAARRWAEATAHADFFCPNYEAAALAPLLIALRNRASSPVRFLLIAHAPGAYGLEWALLQPLLQPGDVIVAPSESAKATIEYLCPVLGAFVTVIPHPMTPLPQAPPVMGRRIVSLGRITARKLVHRQVEAMHILRARGEQLPRMEIAGSLCDEGSTTWHRCARAVIEKVRRLHLEDHVTFPGPIHGDEAKARFLSGAALLVNLSVTVEESFGKAPVEALGAGVPVLATAWDGLPETVGAGGEMVPVDAAACGGADVSADAIADGLARLLAAPPSAAACRDQAARFHPDVILPRYRRALEGALDIARSYAGSDAPWPAPDRRGAPAAGLLGAVAPLTQMSWQEIFDHHVESCTAIRRTWNGERPAQPSSGDRLRMLVLHATQQPLERWLGGQGTTPVPTVNDPPLLDRRLDLVARVAASALSPGLLTARLACLAEARQAGRSAPLRAGLDQLEREGLRVPAIELLRAELEHLEGDLPAALARCLRGLDPLGDSGFDACRLLQLARIARAAGQPERALGPMAAWLEQFPDALDAGPVWLERAVNAMRAGAQHLPDAAAALQRARVLLGTLTVVDKVEAELDVRLRDAAAAVCATALCGPAA